MYGILTYIWATFVINVGKYSLHGASGIYDVYISPCALRVVGCSPVL